MTVSSTLLRRNLRSFSTEIASIESTVNGEQFAKSNAAKLTVKRRNHIISNLFLELIADTLLQKKATPFLQIYSSLDCYSSLASFTLLPLEPFFFVATVCQIVGHLPVQQQQEEEEHKKKIGCKEAAPFFGYFTTTLQ